MFFCLFLLFVGSARAQDTQNDSGVHPLRSYLQDTETVSTGTGNSSIIIPLLSLPGRAGNTLTIGYSFNSQIWSPTQIAYQCVPPSSNGTQPLQTCVLFPWSRVGEHSLALGSFTVPTIMGGTATYFPGTQQIRCIYAPTLTLPNGAVYTFQRAIYGCQFNGGGADPYDSTNPVVLDDQNGGILMDATDLNHLTFKMPDGSMYIQQNSTQAYPPIDYVDRNGNVTTYTYVLNSSGDEK